MRDGLADLFLDPEFSDASFTGAASPENLFSILESLEDVTKEVLPFSPPFEEAFVSPRESGEPSPRVASQKSVSLGATHLETDEDDEEASQVARKKLKFTAPAAIAEEQQDGQQRMSHITVERNRRKQMNDHLTVLRSLMPCFYVKRGDQASIIGGVVDYIKELQQVLQSLESKKQRKVYSEVLSPRPVSSPRPSPLSPRPPPLSPRMSLPVSPRTPQPGSPYRPRLQQVYLNPPTMASSHESSPSYDNLSELVANSKSPIADVEVKFSGANVLLKTVSHRIPGQALKIISALEGLSLEILQVNISTIDDTMLNSFTIKIGIECELSAEELAHEVQQTFS